MPNNIKNAVGKRYGMLTVSERTPERINKYVVYKCVCDCGNVCFRTSKQLLQDKVESCGCLKIANGKKCMKKITEKALVEKTNLDVIKQKTGTNKTTGRKIGVHWDKKACKWRVQIFFQGQAHYCGSFKSYDEAVKARIEAEEKYFVPILEKYDRN